MLTTDLSTVHVSHLDYNMAKIKVGVVGYGVIGKRVCDAVHVQSDMTLVGVADILSDAKIRVAQQKGYAMYCSVPSFAPKMEADGIKLEGMFEDFVKKCDVVVDCTPKGIPEKNMPLYKEHGVKVVVHGGEKHAKYGASFSTFTNYADNIGLDVTRVVSCNTTALSRTLAVVAQEFGIEDASVAIARRSADPLRTDRGPTNAVVPVLGVSHHGPDVVTVMEELEGKIYSQAIAASFTLSHVHMVRIKLSRDITRDEAIAAFNAYPRIIVGKGKDGLQDSAQLVELYRDLGRPRYDRPEVFIWEETIDVSPDAEGKPVLYYIMDVHMESIPIPECVDVLRALMGTESDAMKSVKKTDEAMGIAKDSSCYEKALLGSTPRSRN